MGFTPGKGIGKHLQGRTQHVKQQIPNNSTLGKK